MGLLVLMVLMRGGYVEVAAGEDVVIVVPGAKRCVVEGGNVDVKVEALDHVRITGRYPGEETMLCFLAEGREAWRIGVGPPAVIDQLPDDFVLALPTSTTKSFRTKLSSAKSENPALAKTKLTGDTLAISGVAVGRTAVVLEGKGVKKRIEVDVYMGDRWMLRNGTYVPALKLKAGTAVTVKVEGVTHVTGTEQVAAELEGPSWIRLTALKPGTSQVKLRRAGEIENATDGLEVTVLAR
jgi:hypothetical protein